MSEKVVVIRRLKLRFQPLEVGIPLDESKRLEVENELDDASRERSRKAEKERKKKETMRNFCPDPKNCRIHVHAKSENGKPSLNISTTADDASTAPVQDDG